MTGERYTLVQDDDSHWYVIPVAAQQEWSDWLEAGEYDYMPSFAFQVGGAPSLVTFSDWEIG